MDKKITKIISIILVCIFMLFIGNTVVLGTDIKSGDSIKQEADDWLNNAKSPIDSSKIAEIIKPIANILLVIGTIVIVAVAIIIGIKYVTAAPDKQAQLKTQLVGLVVSAVVLFGAYGIWAITYRILDGVFS